MTQDFFAGNRHSLFVPADDGLYVVTAYTQTQRGNDAAFAFEQEANFWYLTGINFPDWWVIITRSKSWLVAPDVDHVHQVFDGSLSSGAARQISGVDEVISYKDGIKVLRDLSKKYSSVGTIGPDPYKKHYDFALNPAQAALQRRLGRMFTEVSDCRQQLSKLRAIKQPQEIAAMRAAIKLTNDTFRTVQAKLASLQFEYEVEAEFTYAFRKAGAAGHAYDPIVASGHHACTLHYNANDSQLHPNSLLLLDIGARVDGYAADITRTYAIGTPTKRQRAVHAAVQSAQQRIIALLKPGFGLKEYSEQVDNIMKSALVSLGLMKDIDDARSYRLYFPHAVSHGLGIDVHDSLGRPDTLLPGMVMTVEPGIYIPEEGIGVRIEDDILITPDGHENLSDDLSTDL